MAKFGAIYCLYDDHEYLGISLFQMSNHLDKVLFLISDVPWNGTVTDNSATIEAVTNLCKQNPQFQLIQGHWTNEIDQRNFGLAEFFKAGIDYAFIVDSDEVYDERDFLRIQNFILANPQVDAFHVEWNTYWKKSYHLIYPREEYRPVVCVKVNHFQFTIIRGGLTAVLRTHSAIIKTEGPYNGFLIPPAIGICHHLSYARTDDYMRRKLEINSHHSEFLPDWYDKVWLKWNSQLRNLHPVTPEQYQVAVKSDFSKLPVQLKKFIKGETLPIRICTVIILNWNSRDLLDRCLCQLWEKTKQEYDVVIVDNGSTEDTSVEYIKSLNPVKSHLLGLKTIFNKENKGFAVGVNQAIKMARADSDICLLNVDAEVQEGWLDKLYESLLNNPDAGIVGPLGNEIENGYQKEGLVTKDTAVANVHGFCMLIMRELIDKIGILDEQFSPGGSEDMDYCMRARLAGYSVVISAGSLVKHKAHQVYDLNGVTSEERMKQDAVHWNRYVDKYFGVLLGYSSAVDLFSQPEMARQAGLVI